MSERIETAEALDALPVGSVVLDRAGDAWMSAHRNRWVTADVRGDCPNAELIRRFGPLALIYRPDAPAPSDEDRGALAERVEDVLATHGCLAAVPTDAIRDLVALAARSSQPAPSVEDCRHERCHDLAVDKFSPCRHTAPSVSAEQVEAARVGVNTAVGFPVLPVGAAEALLKRLGIEVTP